MKKILQMNYENIKDIPKYKIVELKDDFTENKILISFTALITEGQFKDTEIEYLYVSYKEKHVDLRTFYNKIMKDGIEKSNKLCEAYLNAISSNIALREITKISQ